MAQTVPLEHLDRGELSAYVNERLFDTSFETLDDHIQRKQALADEGRYTILYLLYEYGELSRKRLSHEADRTSNKLQQPLRELMEADLIEKIPGPPDVDQRKTYYRITPIGQQAIASDLRHIVGGTADEEYYQLLRDPALNPDLDPDASRIRHPNGLIVETEPAGLQSQQHRLREQHTSLDAELLVTDDK
jgi:DNA-binding MarR family transcriptional regulator